LAGCIPRLLAGTSILCAISSASAPMPARPRFRPPLRRGPIRAQMDESALPCPRRRPQPCALGISTLDHLLGATFAFPNLADPDSAAAPIQRAHHVPCSCPPLGRPKTSPLTRHMPPPRRVFFFTMTLNFKLKKHRRARPARPRTGPQCFDQYYVWRPCAPRASRAAHRPPF
jgi:hypothetical protein